MTATRISAAGLETKPAQAASAPSPETSRWFAALSILVVVIAASKLALHLYTGRHYGYFVDELYYLDSSDHLDWGYVDQPPLIALVTRIVRILLGDFLPAIRLVPALAGAALVLLTGLLTRDLGGHFA